MNKNAPNLLHGVSHLRRQFIVSFALFVSNDDDDRYSGRSKNKSHLTSNNTQQKGTEPHRRFRVKVKKGRWLT